MFATDIASSQAQESFFQRNISQPPPRVDLRDTNNLPRPEQINRYEQVPAQDYIVRVTYPDSRTQDMAYDSKFIPMGVRNELLRLQNTGYIPQIQTNGFSYSMRKAEDQDFRVQMTVGTSDNTIMHGSTSLNGIDISLLPVKKPGDRVEQDDIFHDNQGHGFYKILEPQFYPSKLYQTQIQAELTQANNYVINELNNRGFENTDINLENLGLIFHFEKNGDTISAKAVQGKDTVDKTLVALQQLQMSPSDNGLVSFIESNIKTSILRNKTNQTELPDFYSSV